MSLLSPPEPGTLDFESELARQSPAVQEAARGLRAMLGDYGVEGDLPLRPASATYRTPEDRQNFRKWGGVIHALPPTDQQKMPALLRLLARAAWALGEFQSAQRDYHNLAEALTDPTAKAEAYYQAYLAAVERPHLHDALYELKFALALEPRRYAPFPLDKYDPEKLLTVDFFGVLARCKLRGTDAAACVRTVETTDLDLGADALVDTYRRLQELGHPNVLKVGQVGTDPADAQRIVLLVEYLEGQSLEAYVQRHGALNQKDVLNIARSIAEGLHAAHQVGVVHRALRPSVVNVQKQKDGTFRTIVADFGITARPALLREAAAEAATRVRTLEGRTLINILDFTAPEQLGKVAGEVGPATDAFGWAKLVCFMMFQTPHPAWHHWQKLPEGMAPLLHRCLAEDPAARPGFQEILDQLAALKPVAQPLGVAAASLSGPVEGSPLQTSVAPPPGVGMAFEPKRGAGVPARRRLTPIEILKIRIQRLTVFYSLIGLAAAVVLGLVWVIFFYKPKEERQAIGPVAGTITCMGEPIAGAKVTFFPENRTLGEIAKGKTDEQGRFVLTSLLPNDGAFPGIYRVTVELDQKTIRVVPTLPGPDPRNPLAGARPNPIQQLSLVHDNYGRPETSPLRVTIPAGGDTNLQLRLNLLGR